jgi:UDP-N-acetylmuramate dehydrogenase
MLNIQEKITLAPYTSFNIGGNARFYVEVNSLEELKEVLQYAKEKNIKPYILGSGTDVLVSDKGFEGIIIKIKMNEINIEKTILKAEAGVPLIKAINVAADAGLSGAETLAGIPGTVGGAVHGNAGAFGTEVGEYVNSVIAFDLLKSEAVSFNNSECEFGYRSSTFKKNKNLIILSVQFDLTIGKQAEIKQKIKETITKRAIKGLSVFKSVGSYFVNPVVENEKLLEEFAKDNGLPSKNGKIPAGWLIDYVGLRGKKIGGAMISEQHANYIINVGNATADDVVMLASFVKQQVRDQLGVQLEEEVNYIGF